jgi:hypothetical protein
MWQKVSKAVALGAMITALSACATLEGKPQHVIGLWGGPHAGANFSGGLADLQFDCASGTIDDPIMITDVGPFSVKGTFRTGASGPIKVGQFFKSQEALFSGEITKGAAKSSPRVMTLSVALEDGTALGPFTLTEGAPPQITRCL